MNIHDTGSEQYQVARADNTMPLASHMPQYSNGNVAEIQVTRLDNGVTVATETPQFPGVVDMNYLLDVGTRDETNGESGALLSMKNTYLKTILTTNETINYGMVQMSGGSSAMLYDQETSQYRASCLAHDVVDIHNMISDCALEPKNVVAANVGIEKSKHSHKLEGHADSGVSFR
jgi:predicted Zn-dependent peptidase